MSRPPRSGPTIDAIGNKLILVTSSVFVAAGIMGFALSHSYVSAAISAVLLGCGGGGLNTSTNALISDLYGEHRGPMLNVLGIFYGIGALCIPLLAGMIAGHLLVATQLFLCAALATGCALLFLATRFPDAVASRSFSWREAIKVAHYPGVLVLGFLLFCQSGDEASIGGWTSTYVEQAGLQAEKATFILAAYWAALMAGRLLVARLLKSVGKEQLVLASGGGALLGASILLTSRSEVMLLAGVIVIGLSYAGVFPTALAIAGDACQKLAGTVFGLLFALALLGGMSFPWAVGYVSQAGGVRYGMAVPLLGSAAICVLAYRVLMTRQRKESASTAK